MHNQKNKLGLFRTFAPSNKCDSAEIYDIYHNELLSYSSEPVSKAILNLMTNDERLTTLLYFSLYKEGLHFDYVLGKVTKNKNSLPEYDGTSSNYERLFEVLRKRNTQHFYRLLKYINSDCFFMCYDKRGSSLLDNLDSIKNIDSMQKVLFDYVIYCGNNGKDLWNYYFETVLWEDLYVPYLYSAAIHEYIMRMDVNSFTARINSINVKLGINENSKVSVNHETALLLAKMLMKIMGIALNDAYAFCTLFKTLRYVNIFELSQHNKYLVDSNHNKPFLEIFRSSSLDANSVLKLAEQMIELWNVEDVLETFFNTPLRMIINIEKLIAIILDSKRFDLPQLNYVLKNFKLLGRIKNGYIHHFDILGDSINISNIKLIDGSVNIGSVYYYLIVSKSGKILCIIDYPKNQIHSEDNQKLLNEEFSVESLPSSLVQAIKNKLPTLKLSNLSLSNTNTIENLFTLLYKDNVQAKKFLLFCICEQNYLVGARCAHRVRNSYILNDIVYHFVNMQTDKYPGKNVLFTDSKHKQFSVKFVIHEKAITKLAVALLLNDDDKISENFPSFIQSINYFNNNYDKLSKYGEKIAQMKAYYFQCFLSDEHIFRLLEYLAENKSEDNFNMVIYFFEDLIPSVEIYPEYYKKLINNLKINKKYISLVKIILKISINSYRKLFDESFNDLLSLADKVSDKSLRQKYLFKLSCTFTTNEQDNNNDIYLKTRYALPYSIKYLYHNAMLQGIQEKNVAEDLLKPVSEIDDLIDLWSNNNKTIVKLDKNSLDKDFIATFVNYLYEIMNHSTNPAHEIKKLCHINPFLHETESSGLQKKTYAQYAYPNEYDRNRALNELQRCSTFLAISDMVEIYFNTHFRCSVEFGNFVEILMMTPNFSYSELNSLLSNYTLLGQIKNPIPVNSPIMVYNLNIHYPCVDLDEGMIDELRKKPAMTFNFNLALTEVKDKHKIIVKNFIKALDDELAKKKLLNTNKYFHVSADESDSDSFLTSLRELSKREKCPLSIIDHLNKNMSVRDTCIDDGIIFNDAFGYLCNILLLHRNNPSKSAIILRKLSILNPFSTQVLPVYYSNINDQRTRCKEIPVQVFTRNDIQMEDISKIAFTIYDALCRNAKLLSDAFYVFINTFLKNYISMYDLVERYSTTKDLSNEIAFDYTLFSLGTLVAEEGNFCFISEDLILPDEKIILDANIIAEGVTDGVPVYSQIHILFNGKSGLKLNVVGCYDEISLFE